MTNVPSNEVRAIACLNWLLMLYYTHSVATEDDSCARWKPLVCQGKDCTWELQQRMTRVRDGNIASRCNNSTSDCVATEDDSCARWKLFNAVGIVEEILVATEDDSCARWKRTTLQARMQRSKVATEDDSCARWKHRQKQNEQALRELQQRMTRVRDGNCSNGTLAL